MRVQVRGRGGARRIAARARLFELGPGRIEADRVGEAPRVAGVALGGGLALRLVAPEKLLARRAAQHVRDLPAKVHGVLDRGVVAEAAGGSEEMRRVAGDED